MRFQLPFTGIRELRNQFLYNERIRPLFYCVRDFFALVSPNEQRNELQHDDKLVSRVCYAFRGHRVCKYAFCAVTNLSVTSIRKHGESVSSTSQFFVYKTNRGLNRIGSSSAETIVVCVFLRRNAERNGLTCPRGRGSSED